MPNFVEMVHPESGGTGRCPEAAVAHQETKGWVRADEYHPMPSFDEPQDSQPAPPPPPVFPPVSEFEDPLDDDEDDDI